MKKYKIFLLSLVSIGTLMMSACGSDKNDEPEPNVPINPNPKPDEPTPDDPKEDPSLSAYKAPDYSDYYRNIAGWDQRSQWNLANVHDPSVVKADDGYYYNVSSI